MTGGAGFIGSHLAQAVAARGNRVLVFDSFDDYYSPAAKRRNLREARASGVVEAVDGDVCNREQVNRVWAEFRPEVVYHLAARVGVRASVTDPAGYERVNVGGTVNVLWSSADAGVRAIVLASSSSVYGNGRPPFAEDAPAVSPLSPYAASKRAAELFASSFCHLTGLPVTVARLFTAFGPRQRPDLAIHKFVRLMEAGQPIPLYGDGTSSRDYTYVGDIVDGLVRAASLGTGFGIINLGSGRTVSLRRVVEVLEEQLGRRARIEPQPPRPEDPEVTWADVDKARLLLDWTPRVSFEEGVRLFLDWHSRTQEAR